MYSSVFSSRTVPAASKSWILGFHEFEEHDTNPFYHEIVPKHCCYFLLNNISPWHFHFIFIVGINAIVIIYF